MPIYGYECEQCGHQLEILQGIKDPPLRTCPECVGPLHKMLYPVGVIFKGSGFYTTDYKNSGSAGGSRSEGKAGSENKSESKSETKSDSKPEAKSETKSDSSKPADAGSSKAEPASA